MMPTVAWFLTLVVVLVVVDAEKPIDVIDKTPPKETK